MKKYLLGILLLPFIGCSSILAQQVAFTFDDLPDHGKLPEGRAVSSS